MNLLEIKNLKKVYQTEAEELEILRDINLNINRGTVTIITGESGSGKSTLLNIIGGLDHADGGAMLFEGKDVVGMNEDALSVYRQESVGFVFQFHYLLKDFSCIENVMMPAYMAGDSKKAAMDKAGELLERVKLGHRIKHYPSRMSGGERQRAALARALINNPDLILADEPTGNLDEENSRTVEELLFRLVADDGKTLLIVTHDLELAGRGDREYHLSKGVLNSK